MRLSGRPLSSSAVSAESTIVSHQLPVAKGAARQGLLGLQPAVPAMAGPVDADLVQHLLQRPVTAALEQAKVACMFAADQDGSPVSCAIRFQSDLVRADRIIALWAVQPPRVPARG